MNGPGFYLAILLYTLPGLVTGLVVHELTHAAMALRLGDPSPQRDRRISIDPRRQLDPLGFAALVLAGFGWARPVTLDPVFLRDSVRRAIVAAAGPLANLLMAAIFGLALRVYLLAAGGDAGSLDALAGVTASHVVYGLLLQGFLVNVALAVFNGLPLPGLDGYQAARSLLYTRIPRVFQWMERQRLVVYAVVAVVVVALPEATHGRVNPYAAATVGLAGTLFSHLVQPGMSPIFLGMPNVFAAFST